MQGLNIWGISISVFTPVMSQARVKQIMWSVSTDIRKGWLLKKTCIKEFFTYFILAVTLNSELVHVSCLNQFCGILRSAFRSLKPKKGLLIHSDTNDLDLVPGVRCWWSDADTKTGPGPPGQVHCPGPLSSYIAMISQMWVTTPPSPGPGPNITLLVYFISEDL